MAHEKGNDVDAYVLDYPAGSTFPKRISVRALSLLFR